MFDGSLRNELVVGRIVAIGHIDAKEPHPPCQRTQVHVNHESGMFDLLRARFRGDIENVAGAQARTRVGRLAVDEQIADLGTRHSQCLDNMTQSRGAIHNHHGYAFAVTDRQHEPQR